jgi:hypothetical protein
MLEEIVTVMFVAEVTVDVAKEFVRTEKEKEERRKKKEGTRSSSSQTAINLETQVL